MTTTLKAVAEAANTGTPWAVVISGILGNESYLVCEDVPGHLKPICATEHGLPESEARAEFIATFNPERVLRILTAYEGMRDVLEKAPKPSSLATAEDHFWAFYEWWDRLVVDALASADAAMGREP